nr:helix-turn-helix domain-containing protein [uncultured Enterobacter sp.]
MSISDQVINEILEWIESNINRPLHIDDIARHAGYSKWHLQRLFYNYKGEPIATYVRNRKLDLAARDLVSSSASVIDISTKYGFESQQSFTRLFKKTFNKPPLAYRKSHCF